jgi:predicted TIM-barrel fold metal-dependent hydrolase
MIIDGHQHIESGYGNILARMDALGIDRTVLIGVGVRDLSVITIRDSLIFHHDILLRTIGQWRARRLLGSKLIKSVLMPQPDNDRVLAAIKEKPDRFYGFAFINPQIEGYMNELARCLDAGMQGIKLALPQYPADLSGKRVFALCEVAEARKIPIFFHQGLTPASSNAFTMVKAFPSVTFILAHAGAHYFHEALQLATANANVFVDTSSYFVTVPKLRRLCREIGPRRLIFGTDVPVMSRDPSEGLAKIRALKLDAADEKWVLGETLQKIIEQH